MMSQPRSTASVAFCVAILVGCSPPPARSQITSAPDADEYAARSRCVRQEVNRMLADPKEADRGSYDMAAYAVGRCSQALWSKIMRRSSAPQRIDERMQDELAERQNALGMIIDAKTRR